MTDTISPELTWLAWVTVLTGLLWLPYISQIITRIGVRTALVEVSGVEPHAPWSRRAKRAHGNAVENLAVFAPLILIVELTGTGSAVTAFAAAAYFVLRIIHAFVFIIGLPYLRTLAFAGGVACQAVLAWAVLA